MLGSCTGVLLPWLMLILRGYMLEYEHEHEHEHESGPTASAGPGSG